MKKRWGRLIFIYLAVYFAANLLFLDKFPFMHSDESWLSGLTRAVMNGGPAATEPFFDLLPRFPHAIKILFHAMQMPLIAIFGYGLFSVRLLSLLFGAAALYLFYRLALRLSGSVAGSLLVTAALSVDVQFLYAAHMARQDIIIAFGVIAVLYYIIRNEGAWGPRRDVIAGALTGVFIGVHPNSLIIALCAGALYLYCIFSGRMRPKNLLFLVLTVAGFAALFVGISFALDSQFIPHYLNVGENLGATQPLGAKLAALPQYYIKLFLGVSGTYYTPPVQLQLIAFGAAFVAGAVIAYKKRDILRVLVPLVAVHIGLVLIGRYSQPGVILVWPLGYLLVFYLLNMLGKKTRLVPGLLLSAAVLAVSVCSIIPYLNNDYSDYIARIRRDVPAGSRVLANLNSEYAFERGELLDYRNLEYLAQSGLSFAQYIKSRGIEYIVYPQEMDFIYKSRPVWNIVYGNLYPYYDDMQRFLLERCTKIDAFASPYAMRIAAYSQSREWTVTVYRVENGGAP